MKLTAEERARIQELAADSPANMSMWDVIARHHKFCETARSDMRRLLGSDAERERENAELTGKLDEAAETYLQEIQTVTALRERVALLREALEPFAKMEHITSPIQRRAKQVYEETGEME